MSPEAHIRVRVDPTNPGQYFACCGLLELADRLWAGAEGWFEDQHFNIRASQPGTLIELLRGFKACRPVDDAPESSTEPEDSVDDGDDDDDAEGGVLPLNLPLAVPLRLDWWLDKSLKPWAGSMNARLIYSAMTQAIDEASPDPFNDSRFVFDPTVQAVTGKRVKRAKKREPFYFDARRGASARSIDIGFAPDAIKKIHAVSYPTVESLCFVGLQRCRPMPASVGPRVFDYYAWTVPLDPRVAAAAVCGLALAGDSRGFRFENAFRTDQRKHKAFSSAVPLI
jgi:CRISPR-associated protein Csb3